MTAALITTPLVIFLIFVAPLWLVLHYRSIKRTNKGLSQEDRDRLEALSERAAAMSDRVRTLEKILDDESPGWREKR
ncbi:envelope stress response membrane protein PspB [Vibrio ulleungensis]|jgi:phage shock protein B|uniref:Envelope stress response membrane protein PspB n=1 Tax=Vibrio ulleungensis TaxID=2807619 RepID=A0ABS2HK37_9VIBR|nr:envelope stress response membrane protein PspB [Vibrio ulleungensis]MBM7036892.1 envelope stress response membrane protein PspB [Vibrio ulleungensis]